MTRDERRSRFLWPAVLLIGVVAYLYSLDGLYIPHIGDEAPYIEIARLTAETGRWLPLRTAPGLENTKPPLLFWLGIAATDGGERFTLWWLRLPIVLCTFLTAALVFVVARHLTGEIERGYLAALTFLGFYSSFQYGRPFLTNLPETLFVFLAFSLVVVAGHYRDRYFPWILAGLSLGVACLFKSFVLVAPVGLALAWFSLVARRWELGPLLRSDLPKIVLASVVALSCFALWPALDPEPGEIVRHFVMEENLGKLEGEGYLRGLFHGRYALHRLWLGHLGNAGLFALPLAYVAVTAFRERRRAPLYEKGLWILVLSFLIVYSFPSQRQENYLIPTVPALAILVAMRWPQIPAGWFRLFNLPLISVSAALLYLMVSVQQDVLPRGSYAWWQWVIPGLGLTGSLAVTVGASVARYAFHGLVFVTFWSIGCATAPFEGPAGRFEAEHVHELEGRRVYVPESFIRRHERHRFLLPGAHIESYDPLDTVTLAKLLESRRTVVVHRALGETDIGPYRVLARRLDLRSRQTLDEMWRILRHRELDLLVHQELVVRRFRPARERQR